MSTYSTTSTSTNSNYWTNNSTTTFGNSATFTYTGTGGNWTSNTNGYTYITFPVITNLPQQSLISWSFTYPVVYFRYILGKGYTKEEFEKLDSSFLNLYLNE